MSQPTPTMSITNGVLEKIIEYSNSEKQLKLVQAELRDNTDLRKEFISVLHGLPCYSNNYTTSTTPLSDEEADDVKDNIAFLDGRIECLLEYKRDMLLLGPEKLMEKILALWVEHGVEEGSLEWCDVNEGIWRVWSGPLDMDTTCKEEGEGEVKIDNVSPK